LSLEDSVSQYLPSDSDVSEKPITIRHLLTHTSGLPNMLPLKANSLLENFIDKRTPQRLNEVIGEYTKKQFLLDFQTLRLTQSSGDAYSYSSAGSELLAYILEQVYDEDYELILEGFTSELKMNQTKISLSQSEQSQLAVGYHLDKLEPAAPMSRLLWGAAGNMKSTPRDILRYLEFQLDQRNQASLESHKVLYRGLNDQSVAYMWNVSKEDFFGNSLHHHGGVPRAQNYMFVAPEKNFGLFIITNQSGDTTPRVLLKALNGIMADIEQLHTQ